MNFKKPKIAHYSYNSILKAFLDFHTFKQGLPGPGAGPGGAMAPALFFGPGPGGAKAPENIFGPGPGGTMAPTNFFAPAPADFLGPGPGPRMWFLAPAPAGPSPRL